MVCVVRSRKSTHIYEYGWPSLHPRATELLGSHTSEEGPRSYTHLLATRNVYKKGLREEVEPPLTLITCKPRNIDTARRTRSTTDCERLLLYKREEENED